MSKTASAFRPIAFALERALSAARKRNWPRLRVDRIERRADAGAEQDGAAVDFERLAEQRANLVGELPHVACRLALDDEGELVAGDARNLTGLMADRLQALRGQAQHFVADRMTPDVVHRAKTVEADDHQPDLLVRRRRALDRVVEVGGQAGPCRHVGQRIARQRVRVEGLSVVAEAAAARHHESDGNHGEHRQPDRHHADEAEGAAERLERAASDRPRR